MKITSERMKVKTEKFRKGLIVFIVDGEMKLVYESRSVKML